MKGKALTILETELIRPEGSLNLARHRRVSDLPRPEEITREMHGVHARHNERLDTIFHVLGPVCPIVPLSAIAETRRRTYTLHPLAALYVNEPVMRSDTCGE